MNAADNKVFKSKKMKIIHFKTYSNDNYYMLVEDGFNMGTPEGFCKQYIPEEYEGWKPGTFKHNGMRKYQVESNGLCIVPCSFGEVNVINTKSMTPGVCLFSDNILYLNKPNGAPYTARDVAAIRNMEIGVSEAPPSDNSSNTEINLGVNPSEVIPEAPEERPQYKVKISKPKTKKGKKKVKTEEK